MLKINKRGQFFLVVTFIIVAIIFSFGVVYNSVQSASVSSSAETISLADSIKYESFQIINNGLYTNQSNITIASNLVSLATYYSKSNPKYNITIAYANSEKSSFNAVQLTDGSVVSQSVPVSSSEIVNVSLNNIIYSFNITKGFNFFVIVQKEENSEKYVATK